MSSYRNEDDKLRIICFIICWVVSTPSLKIFTDLTLLASVGLGFVIACVLTFGGIILGEIDFD